MKCLDIASKSTLLGLRQAVGLTKQELCQRPTHSSGRQVLLFPILVAGNQRGKLLNWRPCHTELFCHYLVSSRWAPLWLSFRYRSRNSLVESLRGASSLLLARLIWLFERLVDLVWALFAKVKSPQGRKGKPFSVHRWGPQAASSTQTCTCPSTCHLQTRSQYLQSICLAMAVPQPADQSASSPAAKVYMQTRASKHQYLS